jgi:hypothetical protein
MAGLGLLQLILYSPNNDTLERRSAIDPHDGSIKNGFHAPSLPEYSQRG